MAEFNPLLRVCKLLNDAGADYLVVGGYARILHGLFRTTKDVDILVEESEPNLGRVIAGLARMEDGAAAELRFNGDPSRIGFTALQENNPRVRLNR